MLVQTYLQTKHCLCLVLE